MSRNNRNGESATNSRIGCGHGNVADCDGNASGDGERVGAATAPFAPVKTISSMNNGDSETASAVVEEAAAGRPRQQLCVFEGVAVPQKLLASFQQAAVASDHCNYQPPFSYSRPLPPSVFPTEELKPACKKTTTRCGPIVPPEAVGAEKRKHLSQRLEEKKKLWEEIDREPTPPTMQHLQYNSPMQLYSRESAEEQYRQQSAGVPNVPGSAPIRLGASERHFDPTKSEALKAIQEQDRDDNFGKNFFDKIAQAEAPNVPNSREPHWANEARQKSERARSATPAAYQHYQMYSNDNFGIPSGPPPTFTSGPELHSNQLGADQWRHRQHRSPSADRHHNPSGLASEKGYQFGGMDFIDHQGDRYQFADNQYYDTYPKPKERKESYYPGYQYGLDYNSGGRVIDGQDRMYYQGYGPQQPRLRPKYSADPHAAINTYTSQNVESVNPVRLIGDTLSNQKVPREKFLTDEEKRTFCVSYAPTGFKRDHVTVRQPPPPPEPLCYSLSAKRRPGSTQPTAANRISVNPRSRTPDASNNDRWYSGRKEVNIQTLLTDEALRVPHISEKPGWADRSGLKHYSWRGITDPRLNRPKVTTTEPSWTRTVNNRRNAWETQAQNVDARVGMPAASKVPAQQPPYWVQQSNTTHNAWENQGYGGRMGSNRSHTQEQPYWTQQSNATQNAWQSQAPVNGYDSHRHEYTQRTTTYGSNQAAPTVTTHTTTTNYQPSRQEVSNYSTRTTMNTQEERPVAPLDNVRSNTTYSYTQSRPVIQQTPGQVVTESSSTSKVENRETSKAIPMPAPPSQQGGYTEQRSRNYEKTTEERFVPSAPVPPPPQESRVIQQNDFNRYYKKQTTEQHGYSPDGRPLPPTRTVTMQKPEDFNRQTEMAEQLPLGSISNSKSNAERNFKDQKGHDINYRRELSTSADPGRECQLLKEEERRVVEEPIEPGVISRHVTTKFYKKKTITDTSTVE